MKAFWTLIREALEKIVIFYSASAEEFFEEKLFIMRFFFENTLGFGLKFPNFRQKCFGRANICILRVRTNTERRQSFFQTRNERLSKASTLITKIGYKIAQSDSKIFSSKYAND